MSRRDGAGPWYQDGLCFTCTACGDCCRGEGHVWVEEPEIERLAAHLQLDLDAFGRGFLRRVGLRLALTDRADGSCVFWSDSDGCTVYPARPTQCRTFPFWGRNLASRRAWGKVVADCPGSGQGRRYGMEEIEALARGEGETS